MNTINNERAMKKSKAQICSALMKLLQTKPYRRITVSQVCDFAGVSRPTFYKNFDSMDAVVRFRLLQLKKVYDRDHSSSGDICAHLTDFYTFVRSNPEIDLLLTKGKLFPIFEEIVREDYQAHLTSMFRTGTETAAVTATISCSCSLATATGPTNMSAMTKAGLKCRICWRMGRSTF